MHKQVSGFMTVDGIHDNLSFGYRDGKLCKIAEDL